MNTESYLYPPTLGELLWVSMTSEKNPGEAFEEIKECSKDILFWPFMREPWTVPDDVLNEHENLDELLNNIEGMERNLDRTNNARFGADSREKLHPKTTIKEGKGDCKSISLLSVAYYRGKEIPSRLLASSDHMTAETLTSQSVENTDHNQIYQQVLEFINERPEENIEYYDGPPVETPLDVSDMIGLKFMCGLEKSGEKILEENTLKLISHYINRFSEIVSHSAYEGLLKQYGEDANSFFKSHQDNGKELMERINAFKIFTSSIELKNQFSSEKLNHLNIAHIYSSLGEDSKAVEHYLQSSPQNKWKAIHILENKLKGCHNSPQKAQEYKERIKSSLIQAGNELASDGKYLEAKEFFSYAGNEESSNILDVLYSEDSGDYQTAAEKCEENGVLGEAISNHLHAENMDRACELGEEHNLDSLVRFVSGEIKEDLKSKEDFLKASEYAKTEGNEEDHNDLVVRYYESNNDQEKAAEFSEQYGMVVRAIENWYSVNNYDEGLRVIRENVSEPEVQEKGKNLFESLKKDKKRLEASNIAKELGWEEEHQELLLRHYEKRNENQNAAQKAEEFGMYERALNNYRRCKQWDNAKAMVDNLDVSFFDGLKLKWDIYKESRRR